MVAVIWKHSNAFEKNSAMVKLAKVTVSEQHAISNRRAVTYWELLHVWETILRKMRDIFHLYYTCY